MRKLYPLLAGLLLTAPAVAMKVAVVQGTAPTSLGTIDLTDASAGFSSDLKAAICVSASSTANHTSSAHAALSVGFAASNSGTTQATQGFLSQDAQATTNTGSTASGSYIYGKNTTAATAATVATASLNAWLSNGIRLDFDDVDTADLINCLLLGGSDIEAKVISGAFPSGSPNDSVIAHGLSGTPDVIVYLGRAGSSATTFDLGLWERGAPGQAGLSYVSTNAAAAVTPNMALSASVVFPSNTGLGTLTHTIQGADGTNVTVRNSDTAQTSTVRMLVLRGTSAQLSAKTGFFTTDTATGATDKITGLSAAAQAALFIGTRMTSVGSSGADSGGAISLGLAANNAGAGIQQGAAVASEDSGSDPSVTKNQASNSQALRILDIAGAADYEATVSAFGTSIEINTSNAAASALEVGYLAFGLADAPTFVSGPTANSGAYNTTTVSMTPSASATLYSVTCAQGQPAPIVAEVKAATCTGGASPLASGNKSVSGADTLVLTQASPLLYVSDYSVLSNGGGDSAVGSSTNIVMAAAADYTTPAALGTICTASPCPVFVYNASVATDIASGDYFSCKNITEPDSLAITWTDDGNFTYAPTSARELLHCKYQDLSAFGMFAGANPADFYINNGAPIGGAPISLTLRIGTAIDALLCTDLFTDPEDDTLTCSSSDTGTGTGDDKRPAGTTTTDGNFDDIADAGPTTEGSGNFTIEACDIAGDCETREISWAVYDDIPMPDCLTDPTLLSSCLSIIEQLPLVDPDIIITGVCDSSVSQTVLSQMPAANDPVEDEITLTYARRCIGLGGRRLGIGLGQGL